MLSAIHFSTLAYTHLLLFLVLPQEHQFWISLWVQARVHEPPDTKKDA